MSEYTRCISMKFGAGCMQTISFCWSGWRKKVPVRGPERRCPKWTISAVSPRTFWTQAILSRLARPEKQSTGMEDTLESKYQFRDGVIFPVRLFYRRVPQGRKGPICRRIWSRGFDKGGVLPELVCPRSQSLLRCNFRRFHFHLSLLGLNIHWNNMIGFWLNNLFVFCSLWTTGHRQQEYQKQVRSVQQ